MPSPRMAQVREVLFFPEPVMASSQSDDQLNEQADGSQHPFCQVHVLEFLVDCMNT